MTQAMNFEFQLKGHLLLFSVVSLRAKTLSQAVCIRKSCFREISVTF